MVWPSASRSALEHDVPDTSPCWHPVHSHLSVHVGREVLCHIHDQDSPDLHDSVNRCDVPAGCFRTGLHHPARIGISVGPDTCVHLVSCRPPFTMGAKLSAGMVTVLFKAVGLACFPDPWTPYVTGEPFQTGPVSTIIPGSMACLHARRMQTGKQLAI